EVELIRNFEGAVNSCAPRYDRCRISLPLDFSFTKRNQVIRIGFSRFRGDVTIKPLVFEEQDRIVASRSGLDQALGIFSIAREHDVPSGRVRIDRLDTLRMERTTFYAAAASHPHDDWIGPLTVAPPAQRRDLIPHLHKAWPGVVGELDLHDRLVASDRHAACNS